MTDELSDRRWRQGLWVTDIIESLPKPGGPYCKRIASVDGHADALGSAGSLPAGNFDGGSGPSARLLHEFLETVTEKHVYKILIRGLAAIPIAFKRFLTGLISGRQQKTGSLFA